MFAHEFTPKLAHHLRSCSEKETGHPDLPKNHRIDLPTIGVATVEHAAAIGLNGIVIQSGNVFVIDPPAVIARADALGLFLWVQEVASWK